MGIFDKLFGGKNQNGNGDEGKIIRVNSDDCEDIGIVTHYKGKPLTGICFELSENSNLSMEIQMKDGLKDGISTEYYDNGKIMLQTKYLKDELVGIVRYFDAEGVNHLEDKECISTEMLVKFDEAYYYADTPYSGISLQRKFGGVAIENYKDGKLISEKWFWKNGVLRVKYDYQEGYSKEIVYQMDDGRLLRETKNGCKITYDDEGNLKEEVNIKNGEAKTFYKSGKIESITSFKGKNSLDYDSVKSFFENGQIKSFRYNHNKINITELYHKDDSIYCIKAYNTGNMELYFDQDNIEITQMNLIPDFMKDTELQIREKYNLKVPQPYVGKLFFRIEKEKFWNSEIYDQKKESWIDNDKNKYCVLCKISIFYNEAEYLNFKAEDYATSNTFGEFYLDNKGNYCEFDFVKNTVDVKRVLEYSSMESIDEDITFHGDENSFLTFVKETFGNNVDINLIKDGKLVKSPGQKSKFSFENITFECEYEKVRRVIEDLIGGEIEETDDDEYEIYASAGQAEDIIESLFPDKYVTVSKGVYYGDFEYDGEEVSDIVQYSGNGEILNYVGGEYDKDFNKPVSNEMFDELEEEETIYYEPKYESFKFILSNKFTSLEDFIKDE